MNAQHCGGIVLCGGRSRRMGTSKAQLAFGPETMLQRVVNLVGSVVRPVVCVAAVDQAVPALPAWASLVRDTEPDRGPLLGLWCGLTALANDRSAALAVSCDLPLLRPAVLHRLVEALDEAELAAIVHQGRYQPLPAVYRVTVAGKVEAWLETGESRLSVVADRVRTVGIADHDLQDVDPELESLRNVNRPEDYQAALERAGFAANLDRPTAGTSL